MSRRVIFGLLMAMMIGLALRCPHLGLRPMHNDEAVNAVKFRALLEQGAYRYDPNEYHGPTLSYLTLLWTKLIGANDFVTLTEGQLRGVTVGLGVALILLLAMVADGLGRAPTIGAAALTAVSPAMVYYSRDYIHEMLLVFFTFLTLAAGWRYWRSRRLGWALLAGAAVGLMQSTKETFVLALAAAGVAGGAALMLNRTRGMNGTSGVEPKLNWGHVAAGMWVWLAVAILCFTSFLTQADGLLDALRTYAPWLQRAAGDSPHVHPWYFYLERLTVFHPKGGPIWSEGLIVVLAVAGGFAAFTGKGAGDSHRGFVRFLAVYTLALAAIYSLIAYKTPWCLLGFWHGAILLAGVGAVAVVRWFSRKWMKCAAATLLVAGAGQLAGQAWQESAHYAADPRNPYVYAQTSPNLLELVEQVRALAGAHPQGKEMLMKVMAPGSDYWPLPWYLRAYPRVGWWTELETNQPATVVIASTRIGAQLDWDKKYVMTGLYQLRPDEFLELYVETGFWRAFVNAREIARRDF